MSSSSNPVKSQYHHFVPRFILRNFAHPFQPPNEQGKGRGKGKQRRGKNRCYPGDPMLHAIDFSKSMVELIETPVARSFGMTDMYRDIADASNQHYLEQELSKLEARAGQIVTKFRKNLEEDEQDAWITRSDRDTLRKFLFIMKYRNSRAHKRWNHQTAESYSENDRERVLSYMQRKGYRKPLDVWFDNLKAMLDLKMDVEQKWMEELRQRAYPDDANWFILHERMMYLALCTPSDQESEFLLTENSYSIHEGPCSFTTDLLTGDMIMRCYTEYHVFALVSPKLIMVLRSSLLPNPKEDSDEEVKQQREILYRLSAIQHNSPGSVKSLLEDLPISKPLVERRGGSLRADDKFCFRFFPTSTKHVNTINSVILDESYKVSTIVFKSHQAARTALEYFLTYGFKNMLVDSALGIEWDEPRFVRMRKLEQAAQLLGSDFAAIIHV